MCPISAYSSVKIRTTIRGSSVRPLSCILMAPYCFQIYFFCDFKFTSKSVYERPMLKTNAFKDFCSKLYCKNFDVLKSS